MSALQRSPGPQPLPGSPGPSESQPSQRSPGSRRPRWSWPAADDRLTNLGLAVLLVTAVGTGLAANTFGTPTLGRWVVALHGAAGLGLLVLSRRKSRIARRSLGRLRRRPGTSLSLVLAGLVVVTVASGLVHGAGLTDRVGPLTIMQVHIGAAVLAVPLAVQHYRRRPWRRARPTTRSAETTRATPSPPTTTAAPAAPTTPAAPTAQAAPTPAVPPATAAPSAAAAGPALPGPSTSTAPPSLGVGRRGLLQGAALAATAGTLYAGWETGLAVAGAPGARRRFTGSHERGSGNPRALPVTQWLDDRVQRLDPATWRLQVGVRRLSLDDLRALPQDDVTAVLDCTSLWWSEQVWRGVRLDRLVDTGARSTGARSTEVRSVEVRSATGYARRFPVEDLRSVWLALECGGRPLAYGHGAPVRVVAPGRRGYWWVKWVTAVRPSGAPWWLQPPYPLT